MPTEDDIKRPIVPGHPLYGYVYGIKIMAARLAEEGVIDGEALATDLMRVLAQNDPPLLLCTPEEMRDD